MKIIILKHVAMIFEIYKFGSYGKKQQDRLIRFKLWLRVLVRDPKQFVRNRDICECSSCGYKGFFATARKGHVHAAFRCPNCESRPRDRNIALFFKKRTQL